MGIFVYCHSLAYVLLLGTVAFRVSFGYYAYQALLYIHLPGSGP